MASTIVRPTLQPVYRVVPASRYSFQELAAIYNDTRVDYIVPMPMNAKRMEVYVRTYDIDLDASVVILDSAGEQASIGVLGIRGDRGWITRLGVLPTRRGHSLGQFLMETLIALGQEHGVGRIQLEVIQGNTPAHRLFEKLGFEETRELMVIRRPPGKPEPAPATPVFQFTPLDDADICFCLEERTSGASWVDENVSLLQAGGLKGYRAERSAGDSGWVVFQQTALQIAYIVMHTPDDICDEMTLALLHHLHQQLPLQDTKVENTPADDLRWPVFQQMGYVEAFRRIEMFLYL